MAVGRSRLANPRGISTQARRSCGRNASDSSPPLLPDNDDERVEFGGGGEEAR